MKFTLTHHSISEIETIEFYLPWTEIIEIFHLAIHLLQEIDKLVIERPMRHKLQRTNRVGNSFKIIALPVGKIIHRVSMPRQSRTMVRNLNDPVHNRIAKMHIGISHIKLSTQHHTPLDSLRCIHLQKQFKILFNRSIAIWTVLAWLGRRTLLCCNLFRTLLVNVSQSSLNHPNGKVPQLPKIIGSIINIAPFESQPLNVIENIFYILCILFAGIGVIEAKITHAVVFFSYAEIHTDSLCMPYVKITIRFWRKPRLYSAAIFAFG